MGVIPKKGGPALVPRSTRAGKLLDILPDCTWREPNLQLEPEFVSDALLTPGWILSRHSADGRLISTDTGGLPIGRDFQRQKWRKAARCQPMNVAGFTMIKALRHGKKRASLESTKRSATVVGLAFFSRS